MKTIKPILTLFFIYISATCLSSAWAFDLTYDLNGFIHDNGDDTYTVQLLNKAGRYYWGYAEEHADGSFSVSVQDMYGEAYNGTATQAWRGAYSLDLENAATEQKAAGIMQVD